MRKLRTAAMLVASAALVLAIAGPATAQGGGHQILVRLSGQAEVPPADADGTGMAVLTRSRLEGATDRLCWVLIAKNIDAPTAAHIHGQATVTGNAGVVVPLSAPTRRGSSHVAISHGCAPAGVADTLLDTIWANKSLYYVNVHNATYPGGAVRGQLG